MSNSENWIFGSALLGLSLVLGAVATAMEPDKNGFSMQSSAPLSLPAFFDGARFPSLQDVWKLSEGEPVVVPQPENAALSQDRVVNDSETPSAAHPARQPTEEADRRAANVRERAEKLSQRFGGRAKTTTPTQGDVSEITTSASPEGPATAPIDPAATVAPKPINANKPAASIGGKTVVPAPKAKRAAIPPVPIRAPRIARVAKRRSPPARNSSNGDKSIGNMIAEAMQNIGSFVGL
jgi:hypothetical protein